MSFLRLFWYRPSLVLATILTIGLFAHQHSNEKASFELKEDDVVMKITFSNNRDNHVFCKQYDDYLWIRFAATSEEDGAKSDHLDIDVWNYSGPGTYAAADPQSNSREGKRWNIWWHKGDSVFVNQANSSPCQLILKKEKDQLQGSFNCDGLELRGGTELLDIKNGSFLVTPVDGNNKQGTRLIKSILRELEKKTAALVIHLARQSAQ